MTKPTRKLDRRVRRTRRQLRHALRTLIEQQAYEEITIQNIVDEADISRATFYLHYKTKDELLLRCFSSFTDDVADHLEHIETSHIPIPDLIQLVFARVMDNRPLYQELKDKPALASVLHQQVRDMIPIIQQTLDATLSKANQPKVSTEWLAYQLAGALCTSTLHWLDNNFDGTAEQMVNQTITHLRAISSIPI